MSQSNATTYQSGPIRSITARCSVSVERMFDGEPILTPVKEHDWESKVVLNPASQLLTDPDRISKLAEQWGFDPRQRQMARNGVVVMVYRAQGDLDHSKKCAPSSAGLAVFSIGMELIWRKPDPVIRPIEEFQSLGVEDARCTELDGVYHLYYTGYSGDIASGKTKVAICHATTRDFIEWSLNGPVSGDLNQVDNKNAVLLPGPLDGRYILLHRPMAGADAKAIHWAESDSPGGPWHTRGMLMASFRYKEFAESWIGAAGPPMPLGSNKFLAIYHQGHYKTDHSREYDLAATLLDFSEPGTAKVGRRLEPLMRPVGQELRGDKELGVDNVVFSCANHVYGDHVHIPYAGADSRIFCARIPLAELLGALAG